MKPLIPSEIRLATISTPAADKSSFTSLKFAWKITAIGHKNNCRNFSPPLKPVLARSHNNNLAPTGRANLIENFYFCKNSLVRNLESLFKSPYGLNRVSDGDIRGAKNNREDKNGARSERIFGGIVGKNKSKLEFFYRMFCFFFLRDDIARLSPEPVSISWELKFRSLPTSIHPFHERIKSLRRQHVKKLLKINM